MTNIFKKIKNNKALQEITSVTLKDFASGRIFIKEFVLRQGKLALLILACTFLYMNNRMVCEKLVSRIDTLNKELVTAKYIATLTETELLEAGREQEIGKIISKHGLDLIDLDMPPYIVKE